ncbi:MAG: hypothetical protein U0105_09355 [Candidatus Obscuribacterales bacterium]
MLLKMVGMKTTLSLLVGALLSGVLMTSGGNCCAAPAKRPSSGLSGVEHALQTADILPNKYSFRVTRRGSEVIVQTYSRPHAPETDIKIEAVLIARIATDKLPDIARVKVQFFNYEVTRYRQVVVTVGDIKAFASGATPKKQLLESLDIAVVDVTGKGSVAGASTTTASVFRDGRLSFSYPQNWTFYPAKDLSSIGNFTISGTHEWATVTVRRQDAPSANVQSTYDEDYTVKNAGTIVRKGPVSVGAYHMTGYQLLTSSYEKGQREKPRFQLHVYFGDPGEIYSLTLQYAAVDSTNMNSEFVRALNSVVLTRR